MAERVWREGRERRVNVERSPSRPGERQSLAGNPGRPSANGRTFIDSNVVEFVQPVPATCTSWGQQQRSSGWRAHEQAEYRAHLHPTPTSRPSPGGRRQRPLRPTTVSATCTSWAPTPISGWRDTAWLIGQGSVPVDSKVKAFAPSPRWDRRPVCVGEQRPASGGRHPAGSRSGRFFIDSPTSTHSPPTRIASRYVYVEGGTITISGTRPS